MPKLTPTTNDKKRAGNGKHPPADITIHRPIGPRITAAHEPLATGEVPAPAIPAYIGGLGFQQYAAGTVLPVNLVPAPAPAPATTPQPQPLKIAILGTAPSSRMLAPFGDPTWKIWACSAGNQNALPRVDAWFEIHSNLLWPENEAFGKPYIEWLKQQSFPVYMQDNSLVPNAIALPREELVAEFGRYFFTSSFAWMMAYAIKLGATEIGLWGVDMASRDEYILQRSGGHFFINEIIRRGIKLFMPKESDLFQPPPLYGFDDSTHFSRKIQVREKELKDRLTAMRGQRDQLSQNITYLEGALEDVDYIRSIWSGVQSSGVL